MFWVAMSLALGASAAPACIKHGMEPSPRATSPRPDLESPARLELDARRLLESGQAPAALERVLRAQTRVAPESRELGRLLELEAEILNAADDPSERRLMALRRALRIWERVSGPEGPDVARIAIPLGHAEVVEGDVGRGEEVFRRALRFQERTHGPSAKEVSSPLFGLLHVDMRLCRVDEAASIAARLWALAESLPAERRDPEFSANALNALAVAAHMRGDHRSGVRHPSGARPRSAHPDLVSLLPIATYGPTGLAKPWRDRQPIGDRSAATRGREHTRRLA